MCVFIISYIFAELLQNCKVRFSIRKVATGFYHLSRKHLRKQKCSTLRGANVCAQDNEPFNCRSSCNWLTHIDASEAGQK
jgi:hypothetical protein